MKKQTFANHLTRIVVIIVALIFVLFTVTSSVLSTKSIREASTQNAYSQLDNIALTVSNTLTGLSSKVNDIVPEVQSAIARPIPDTDAIVQEVCHLIAVTPAIHTVSVMIEPRNISGSDGYHLYAGTPGGDITIFTTHNDSPDYTSTDIYAAAKSLRSPFWCDSCLARRDHSQSCSYVCPLFDEQQQFEGVIVIEVPMTHIADIMGDVHPYEHSFNVLLGRNARILIHPLMDLTNTESLYTLAEQYDKPGYAKIADDLQEGKRGMYSGNSSSGKRAYIFYRPVDNTGWSVGLVCPHANVYKSVTSHALVLLFLSIVVLALLFFIVRAIVRKVTHPISEFADTARKLATGDFSAPLPQIHSHDEMEDLQNAFSSMQSSLHTYMEQLKTDTAEHQRIASDLATASRIQLDMLPHSASQLAGCDHMDICATLHPAKDVGGDLYDYYSNGKQLYVAIGDVSGKGIPAALFMAMVRSVIRSLMTSGGTPSEILRTANSTAYEGNTSSMFVTLFLASIDLATGMMTYCNAGHNAPIVVTAEGDVSEIPVDTNLPIGIMSDFDFVDQQFQLRNEMLMLLYTDGVSESESPNNELYGIPRLMESLRFSKDLRSPLVISHLMEDIRRHANGKAQSDDIAMVALRHFDTSDKVYESKLTFTNEITSIDQLYDFVDNLVSGSHISDSFKQKLILALEEPIANVVKYAYPPDEVGRHTFDLVFEKYNNDFQFVLTDDGVPFDPTMRPEPDLDQPIETRPIGGLGIYLMKEIMDTVSYRYEDGKNILILRKAYTPEVTQ